MNLRKAMNYADMAVAFDGMGNQDSAHSKLTKALYYIKRSVDHTDRFTKTERDGFAAGISSNLGTFWADRNKVDSAEFYFLKALKINKNAKNNASIFFVYNQFGEFCLKNKKYKEAIENFEKAIQLSKESVDLFRNNTAYKGIAKAYLLIGNEKKSTAYTQEFIKINDSITASEKIGVNTAVKKIVNEEKTIQEQTRSRLHLIIGGIVILIIIFSCLAFWFHQNMKKKKDVAISDSAVRLAKKREIIVQKENEAQELKQKVNESFEDVVQLAKDNSPEFLTRFQEIYPKFCSSILKINPNLVSSELKFCALLFLNFSTKDIAEYTFTSPKTVQNRKNGIRKKLNISSDTDLYIWFKNL